MNEKIVITTDGKTTTAVQYDGKKRIAEAKTVCSADDTFDFLTGAKIALGRLNVCNNSGEHSGWVVVDRKPRVGDHVRLTCSGGFSFSRAGDILPVDKCLNNGIKVRGLHHPNTFRLVVFDPPHLIKSGTTGWITKKYGHLDDTWPQMLHDGFAECMRVLAPGGTLVFKWSEHDIPAALVWKAIGQKPLFGHHSGKKSQTFWGCFMKLEGVGKTTKEEST